MSRYTMRMLLGDITMTLTMQPIEIDRVMNIANDRKTHVNVDVLVENGEGVQMTTSVIVVQDGRWQDRLAHSTAEGVMKTLYEHGYMVGEEVKP